MQKTTISPEGRELLRHPSYFQELSRTTEIESVDGKTTLPAATIFAHAIRFLGQHLLKQLKLEAGGDFSPDLIRWVLTVPAIWKDKAKQFMREAFYKVNIFFCLGENAFPKTYLCVF